MTFVNRRRIYSREKAQEAQEIKLFYNFELYVRFCG
jgi:hypothetical protein